MKKIYLRPITEVITIKQQEQLLSGSPKGEGGDLPDADAKGNDYGFNDDDESFTIKTKDLWADDEDL